MFKLTRNGSINTLLTDGGKITLGDDFSIDENGNLNISGTVGVHTDDELSTESDNPLKNRVLTSFLYSKKLLEPEEFEELNTKIDNIETTPGKSAYELYVDSVPEGEEVMTEQEWIESLKGAAFTFNDFTPELLEALRGYQGPQGELGPTGEQGQPGENSYFHVAYCNMINGTVVDFSLNDTTNREYIGTYVDNKVSPSLDPSFYTWMKVKGALGEDGQQGIPGVNGQDGNTSYLHIKYSNDGGLHFTENNGETPGDYLGQYVDTIETDSNVPNRYKWALIKGIDGTDGKDGTSINILGAYDTQEELEAAVDTTNLQAGSSYIVGSDLVIWTGTEWKNVGQIKGADGRDGERGEAGQSSYLHIAWANAVGNTVDEFVQFTITKEDRNLNFNYMGIYTDNNSNDSTNPLDYVWTLIKGDTGTFDASVLANYALIEDLENYQAIANIKTQVESNTGDIQSNATSIGTLRSNLAEATSTFNTKFEEVNGDIETNSEAISGLTSRLGTAEATLGTKASQTDVNELSGIVQTNSSSILSLQSGLQSANANIATKASQSSVNELSQKVNTNTESIVGLTSDLESATATISTKADKSVLDDYVTSEAFGEFTSSYDEAQTTLGSRLEGIEGNIQTNTSSIGTLRSDLNSANAVIATKASQTSVDTLGNTVSSHTTSIATLNSNLESANAAISTKANKTDLDDYVTTESFGTFQSDYDSAQTTLGTRLNTIEGNISTNSSSIATLLSDLDSAEATISTNYNTLSGQISNKLNTSDFWTTLGYTNREAFEQAISEAGGLTPEQLALLESLTPDDYLTSSSLLSLVSDEDFASTDLGSAILSVTRDNVSDNKILNVTNSASNLQTIADSVSASSALTNKFATITALNNETTARTNAISTLTNTVNNKIGSAELSTALSDYYTKSDIDDGFYDKDTVDGKIATAKTEARSGLLLTSELGQAIADLNTYYTKTQADAATTTAIGNFRTEANSTYAKTSDITEFITEDDASGLISTATAGLVAQADYNSAQSTMSTRIGNVESSISNAVMRDPTTGKVTSTVTFGADNAELNADGSGYLANGNLSWDEDGAMTIQTLEDTSSNRNRITVTEDGFHFLGQGIRATGTFDLNLNGIKFTKPGNSFGYGTTYSLGIDLFGLLISGANGVSSLQSGQILLDLGRTYDGTNYTHNPKLELTNELYYTGGILIPRNKVSVVANKTDYHGNTIYGTDRITGTSGFAFTIDNPLTAQSFTKNGSSDSEVLLGGGGTKALSDFAQLNQSGTLSINGLSVGSNSLSSSGLYLSSNNGIYVGGNVETSTIHGHNGTSGLTLSSEINNGYKIKLDSSGIHFVKSDGSSYLLDLETAVNAGFLIDEGAEAIPEQQESYNWDEDLYKVIQIIIDQLNLTSDEGILPSTTFESLGADNLDVTEIINTVENLIGLDIPSSDRTFTTVGLLVNYVTEHMEEVIEEPIDPTDPIEEPTEE